jgi:hypothetical protein
MENALSKLYFWSLQLVIFQRFLMVKPSQNMLIIRPKLMECVLIRLGGLAMLVALHILGDDERIVFISRPNEE